MCCAFARMSDIIGMGFGAACLLFLVLFYALTFITSPGRAALWALGITSVLTVAGAFAAIELAKSL
jgi:hypothetical protein